MDFRPEEATPQTGWSKRPDGGIGQTPYRPAGEMMSDRPERRARGLGWFSIGLGVAQLTACRALTRLTIGSDDTRKRQTMLAVGVRELVTGIGILRRPRPAAWLWARVAGDVVDLALLASALGARRANRARVFGSMAGVLGVTALDLATSIQLSRRTRMGVRADRALEVTKSVTINRSAEEVYRFWRNFQNLSQFMVNLESVRTLDDRRSHWVAKGPAGAKVEWDAQIVEDRSNELISWRSTGGDVETTGTVRFKRAPGGRGTEIEVEMEYRPPGGLFGASLAKLFGKDPRNTVEGDLRRFKQVMETGEVVHSDASIHPGMHPARPSEEPMVNPPGGARTRRGGQR
jgi:uncharacterized membrane protein